MGQAMIHVSRFMAPCVAALAAVAMSSPVRAEPATPDALKKARSNCLTSVAKVVGLSRASLKVIKQTSDGSEISVDVSVPKATAPWGCLTDRQGTVEDVHFKGSEGAL